ncbi:RNA methyltransferase [Flavobacteriaceae bacterium]|nr:RNA methyltransferase [Flavobacteriaceae bacterium]MDC1218683.1 RNA methyltransferase [Flavobacteriaceae bacterium]
MVVKSQLKLIKSLHQKKNRTQHGLFIVEGEKGIADALANDLIPYKLLSSQVGSDINSFEKISEKEFSQISALKNPNGYLGVFNIPKQAALDFKDWVVVIDGLQDPGNLGTIIRLCDWFGIKQILCSPDTVDVYNPKVVQASMGSLTRVSVYYEPIIPLINRFNIPVYGTFMEGTPIQKIVFKTPGIIVFGNEGNGISTELSNHITEKISISSHPASKAESLNVANAAAIVFYEMRR